MYKRNKICFENSSVEYSSIMQTIILEIYAYTYQPHILLCVIVIFASMLTLG